MANAPHSDDDDDISLTFTTRSEPRSTYSISEILAEGFIDVDNEYGDSVPAKHYLVRWRGYNWFDNSWEPETNLAQDAPDTILDWGQSQKLQREGKAPPFDVYRWLDDMKAWEDKNRRRRQKRNQLRQRRGLPTWPEPFSGAKYEDQLEEKLPSLSSSFTNDSLFVDKDQSPVEEIHATPQQQSKPTQVIKPAPHRPLSDHDDDDDDDEDDDDQPLRVLSRKRRGLEAFPVPASHVDPPPRKRQRVVPGTVVKSSEAPINTIVSTAKPVTPNPTVKATNSQSLTRADLDKTLVRSKPRAVGSRSIKPVNGPGGRSAAALRAPPKAFPTRQALYRANKTRETHPQKFHNLMLRTMDGKEVVGSAAIPSAPNLRRRSSFETRQPVMAPQAPSKYQSLECWHWKSGAPHPTGRICPFEHERTGFAAPLDNQLHKDQATCSHWFRGQCVKPDRFCKWSHQVTRYLVEADGLPQKWNPDLAERIFEQRQHESQTNAVPGSQDRPDPASAAASSKVYTGPVSKYLTKVPRTDPRAPLHLPKAVLGCFYHHVYGPGRCKKSADECRFRHSPVDWAVDSRFDFFWVGEVSNSPPPWLAEPQHNIFEPVMVDASREAGPPTGASLGCYFHHINGKCTKPRCVFDHGPVDWVKGMRPDVFYWIGQLSHTPLPPVARRSSGSQHVGHRDRKSPEPLVSSAKDVRRSSLPSTIAVPATTTAVPMRNAASATTDKDFSSMIPQSALGRYMDVSLKTANNESLLLHCQFVGLTPELASRYLGDADSNEKWETSEMISAEVLSSLPERQRQVFVRGDLRAKSPGQITDTLDLAGGAAIFHRKQFSMLIFPKPKATTEQTWRFLDPEPPDGTSSLRYAFVTPLMGSTSIPPGVSASKQYLRQLHADFAKMHLDRMSRQRDILLAFPARLAEEQATFAQSLQDRQINVYSIHDQGAWERFTNNVSSGGIIFHSSFSSFAQLPGFASILCEKDRISLARLSFAEKPTPNPLIDKPQLQNIFPYGRAIMVLDDVFDGHEDEALQVVTYLKERIGNQRSGTMYNRILGRPGLLDWVKARSFTEFEEVTKTLPSGVKPPDDAIPISNTYEALHDLARRQSSVVTPQPLELVQYESQYAQDRNAALLQLIDWFSEWAVDNCNYIRRFIVITIGTHAQKRSWAATYRHLSFMTPSQYEAYEARIGKRKREAEELDVNKRVAADPMSPETPSMHSPSHLQTPRSPDRKRTDQPASTTSSGAAVTQLPADPRLRRRAQN